MLLGAPGTPTKSSDTRQAKASACAMMSARLASTGRAMVRCFTTCTGQPVCAERPPAAAFTGHAQPRLHARHQPGTLTHNEEQWRLQSGKLPHLGDQGLADFAEEGLRKAREQVHVRDLPQGRQVTAAPWCERTFSS